MSMTLAFKIILIGDPGVGKTSLIFRYIENKFKDNYIPTLGVDFLTKKVIVGEKKIPANLIIWDIGGQKKWQKNLHLYLKGADGAIIIYDITRKQTFNNLDEWINNILNHAGNIPYLLIGNKKDLEKERNVSLEDAISYSKSKDNVKLLETSAKTGDLVNDMFIKIAEDVIMHKAKMQVKFSKN